MTPHLLRHRLSRTALLRGTALQAAFALMVVPAHAQPAPNARPQGGQVVAGAATIARASTNTVVSQSTDRAAIDWRSFNVGKNQSVTFQQPSATSATLNRVTGPDPSAIAGRITANGQVILTNPNGVTFFHGAQVNAQSLVVSAPGISNQNFMAGRMMFDQAAKPNARIENAGTITVKQTGLAALVAPSVANSGTINARLGHVVLAGAAAHTLDMYGDGLVSIDVTKQVVQTPTKPGGKPVTALVTNTGTIRADGGTIQLTARAADGVVQTLVDAGGALRADTVGAKAGQIEIAGTGGAVIIAGRIATDARNGQAGTIVLNGSTATTLTDGAHVTANGATGGGTIAVGTTLARARAIGPAPAATSARTTIAAGARLTANATRRGDGGRVTVLSTQSTKMAGTVQAKGGTQAGHGGTVELSGEAGFRLTGKVDAGAPHGRGGDVVLDPRDLYIINDNATPPAGTQPTQPSRTDPNIGAATGGTTTDSYVTVRQLVGVSAGTIHVVTTRDLTVSGTLDIDTDMTLEAGRNLTVASTGSIVVPYSLALKAASSAISGYDPSGKLTIAGSITGPNILLQAGTGGIALAADVNPTRALQTHELQPVTLHVGTPGALTQTAGIVNVPQMYGSAGSVSLTDANTIAGVGNGQNAAFQTTAGGFSVSNAVGQGLAIGNAQGGGGLFVPTGQTVSLAVDTLTLAAATNSTAISAPGGTLLLKPATSDRSILVSATDNTDGSALLVTPASLSTLAVGTLQLGNRPQSIGSITLGQANEAVDLTRAGIANLVLSTNGIIGQGGPLTVANLAVYTTNGTDLSNTANQIATLNGLGANSPTSITTVGNLALTGNLGVDAATIIAGGNITQSATSSLTASDSLTLSAGDPSITGFNPAAAITLAGRVRPANTLSLSAGTGGIALTGSVFTTDINVSTTGALTQGTSFISASTLSGTAGSVNLPSATNSIDAVPSLTATSPTGGVVLVAGPTLTVGTVSERRSGITTQSSRTIDVVTDSLTFAIDAATLSAPGGVVQIQPFTASTPILLSSIAPSPANTLTLTGDDLSRIAAYQLVLGGTNPANGQRNTGTITLGRSDEAILLTQDGFGALGLNTTGAVVQGGPLFVPTISGNVGSLSLPIAGDTVSTTGNQIGTIAGIVATGNITFHTDSALDVGATTQAGGNLSLSSSGAAGMTLFGSLSGQTITLNSLSLNAATPTASDPRIIQTGGSITATTLTGAAGTAQFGNANTVTNLGAFATYGGLRLNDGTTPLAITGAVSNTTGAISLTAAGITQTAAASLTTPEFDGSSTAATTLTARGNAVQAIGTFTQTAGDFTLATSATALAVHQIAANNGSLSFIADGIAVPASKRAGPAISATTGSVTFAPYTAGRRIELIGNGAADPNSLSLGVGVTSQVSAQRLILDTTGRIAIGNGGDTIDLRSATGTLQLQRPAAVTEGANSSLLVDTLTGTAGSLNLASAINAIPVVDAFTADNGDLALRTTGSLAVNGTTAKGALFLTAGGDLSASGNLSAGSTATLIAAGTVTNSGAVQAADIAMTGGAGITQSAGTLAATGGVTLTAPGRSIIQAGGTITAAALTTDSTILSLPHANTVATASLSATTAATLNDAATLNLASLSTIDGTITSAGDLTLTGSIAATGTLALRAGNAISQPGGALVTGALTAAARQITLAQSNAIATLAAASSTGGLTVTDAGPLTVTGPLTDPTGITLHIGGDLVLSGPLTTGALTLTAGLAITQPGGAITAASLSGSAASATLGGANQVDTVAFATTGGFALTDARALTVTGPLTDQAAGITLSAPSITLAGPVAAPSLNVTSPGTVTQTAGTLTIGTLTGTAGSIDIGNQAPANIGALGPLAASSAIALTNQAPLHITGPLASPTLAIAATGALVLDGGTIRTDGQPLAAQLGTTPAPGGSTLAVRPDTSGNASLEQRGTTTLTGYAGGTATLRFDLQSGTLAFDDFEAPGGNLVLSLGNGTATGTLRAGQLAILGTGGSATLTGQIGTRSDNTAAQIAQLLPGTDLRYTFNSCAIAAAGCFSEAVGSVFQPTAAIVSILRPDILTLGILDLTVTRDRDDPTLLLPNISDRDY